MKYGTTHLIVLIAYPKMLQHMCRVSDTTHMLQHFSGVSIATLQLIIKLSTWQLFMHT